MSDLIEIRDAARAFREERDWEKFQDPKSVMLALVGEVGELSMAKLKSPLVAK